MRLYNLQREDILLHVLEAERLLECIQRHQHLVFSDTCYIVNITCQFEGAYASARVVNSSLTAASFQLMTYVNTTSSDCIFHITVLN